MRAPEAVSPEKVLSAIALIDADSLLVIEEASSVVKLMIPKVSPAEMVAEVFSRVKILEPVVLLMHYYFKIKPETKFLVH
mgnify:CR=1 FL=1